MLRVGIAGIGFMGMIHYLAWQRVKGARVTAIASRDPAKRGGDWRSIRGNFGPPGEAMDLGGKLTYAELAELLADPQIDLVDLCLPPDRHCEATVAALKAGKHVLCEKPIALTTAEAGKMIKASHTAGKQLLIAHVLPFTGEYAQAYKLIAGRKHGKLLGGQFKRIISDPLWLKHFYDPRQVGGPMIDLHVHDAHFIRLTCGMPRAVFTSGRMRGEVAEFFSSQFLFDDPDLAVAATSGVIRQQGRAFTHGFEIHLERATLVYDFAVVDGQPQLHVPLTIFTRDGRTLRPEIPSADPIDAFAGELRETLKAVRAGRASPLLDGQLAEDALLLCARQTASLRSGKLVKV